MKYMEREYDYIEVVNDNKTEKILEKLPGFIVKWFLKKNVEFVRNSMGTLPNKDLTTTDIYIDEQFIDGNEEKIKIRLYKPLKEGIKPLHLYLHGGAWIGGSIEPVHNYCKLVCETSGAIVISVDYRLAPEAKYPENLLDCYQALRWAIENAVDLNIDTKNVSICGDSAGGNLAAALAQLARDKNEFKIHKQILLYPVLDLRRTMSTEFREPDYFGEAMKELYVNSKKEYNDPYVSPIVNEDLTNLPKSLIVVGSLDSLHIIAKEYAEKLAEAGNDSTFILFKNTRHAFIEQLGYLDQAKDLVEITSKFIAK